MKTQRLNILYTHSSAGLFGSDKSLFYILNYLDKERFRPLVVLPGKGPLVEKLKNAGIHVIFPPCMGIIRRFRGPAGMALYFFKLAMEIVWLIVLLKKNKISLVHVNTTSILGGMIAARVCGIPSVCHVREIRVSPKWIGKLLATMVNVFS
ncbi:MAG: glycosyltransferase family 1 protein, partial [Nitrospinales bacterium]